MSDDDTPRPPLTNLFGDVLFNEPPPTPPPRNLIKHRVAQVAAEIAAEDPRDLLYQHTVLCQTFLPYRDPGNVRIWERWNGDVHLKVLAGEAMHPRKGRGLVELGLPYGPKPRLVLMHLNQRALLAKSPVIEMIDNSLNAFVKRLKLDTGGRTTHAVREQLARLSASTMRLGVVRDGRALTVTTQVVTAFEVWLAEDPQQRALWPTRVRLSHEYWESLQAHAVPLDERAIAGLSHSAMALDAYAWLAQRLHRVPATRPVLLYWPVLHRQFGAGYDRLDNFRPSFKAALTQVAGLYPAAKFEIDGQGMTLRHSPPPVAAKLFLTGGKP